MKRLLYLVIFVIGLFIFNNNVFALYGNMTSDKTRNESNNYLVNKKWDVTSSNLTNVLNTPYVDSSLKVYDYSNILSSSSELTLRSKINDFVNKHNMDLVIVTIDLPYSYDKYHNTVASDFYDYNDFGIDFKHYSGILLLRNTYSSDPYYDMYTFGDAQLYFNSYRYDYVLDSIYDDLHYGNYEDGFSSFIDYCDDYITSGVPDNLSDSYINDSDNSIVYGNKYINSPEYTGKKPISAGAIGIYSFIFSAIVTSIFLGINISKNKMVIAAKNANEYLDKKSLNFTVKEDRFITSHTSSVRITSSSSGGGGGGGHSSFGSSGGGFSSGGGRHG